MLRPILFIEKIKIMLANLSSLDRHDIASLQSTIHRSDNIVTHTLVMLQRAEALTLKRCIVDIDVDTIPTRNKAIAFAVIKPLYNTLHCQIVKV